MQCQCNAQGPLSKLERAPSHRKINVTSKSPVGDISVVTLIRTDTTLDHSQKAEKVCSTDLAWRCLCGLQVRGNAWRVCALLNTCAHTDTHAGTDNDTHTHTHTRNALPSTPQRSGQQSARQLLSAINHRCNSNICNCCSLGRCKDRAVPCHTGTPHLSRVRGNTKQHPQQ